MFRKSMSAGNFDVSFRDLDSLSGTVKGRDTRIKQVWFETLCGDYLPIKGIKQDDDGDIILLQGWG